MMKTIIELKEKYDLHMKVERYVSDDGGIPKANAVFKKMLDLELTPGCIMIVINIQRVFNVTFGPGCRNNWHIHNADKGGGQTLICVAGRGYYQEQGKDAILEAVSDEEYGRLK